MSKKRVTKSINNQQMQNLNQFTFDEKNNQNSKIDRKIPRKNNSKPNQRSKTQQFLFDQSALQPNKEEQHYQSNTISLKNLNIKKKKVNKKQENQGIRILQEKQTSRIFQHLCNPDGLITVESLGRIMVRAKKQFEVEDLENMIAYYDTIRRKMKQKDTEKVNKKESQQKHQRPAAVELEIMRQFPKYKQDQQQNFQDELDQSIQEDSIKSNPSQQWKSELTFEEFKLLKQYFDK